MEECDTPSGSRAQPPVTPSQPTQENGSISAQAIRGSPGCRCGTLGRWRRGSWGGSWKGVGIGGVERESLLFWPPSPGDRVPLNHF